MMVSHSRALTLCVLALVVAQGCGESDPVEPFGSGTRLRAVFDEGSTGARRLIHFDDTELNVDCGFRSVDSEGVYCLPTTTIVTGFSDPNCTIPAVTGELTSGDLVTGWVDLGISPCGDVPIRGQPFRIGDRIAGDFYQSFNAGACTVAGPDAPDMRVLIPEPLTSFQHAELVEYSDVRRIESDDGAWQNHSMVADGARCGFTDSGDCVPGLTSVFQRNEFEGASCQGEGLGRTLAPLECDFAPRYTRFGTSGCDQVVRTLEPSGAPGSTEADDMCIAWEDLEVPPQNYGGQWTWVRFGEQLEPPTVAVTSRLLGDGRIKARYESFDGERALVFGGFVDTDDRADADVSCSPIELGDALVYCIPTERAFMSASTPFFADSECTVPRARWFRSECSDAPLPSLIQVSPDDDEADRFFEAIEDTGDMYFGSDGACTLIQDSPTEHYFEFGTELVPSEAFGVITRRTD